MVSKEKSEKIWTVQNSKVAPKADHNDTCQPSVQKAGDERLAVRSTRFFEDVSVAGVKYVVDGGAHKLRRGIWLLLVLGSLAFMIYQVQERIRYYRGFPTTVDVRLHYNESIVFPTVTVCNENQVKKCVADAENVTWIYKSFFPPFELPHFQYPDYSILPRGNSTDWVALFTKLAQPSWEAIHWSSWKGARINHTWFIPVWTDMGLCYQFNSGQAFSVNRAGAKVGLSLLLYVDQLNYLHTNSEAAGFRVLLHGAREVPRMTDLGMSISAGSKVGASIAIRKVRSLPYPYTDCNNASDYVQSQCQMKCEADYVISQCRCRETYMPGTGVRICDFYDHFVCVYGAKLKFISEGVHKQCQCPQQCNTVHYTTSLSASAASNFLAGFISKVLYKGVQTPLFVKENYCMLDVYMSDLSYEEITMKTAYSPLALLCDIGGATGLLLGSTLLTLVEIGDFILSQICCRMAK